MYWPMLRPFGRKSELAVGEIDPFTALRREMDRLFDSFGRDVGWPAEGSRVAAMTPSIDVSESEGELKIDVDLPGVEEKDVDVAILRLVLALAHAAVRRRSRPGESDLQERRAVDQSAEAARSSGQGEEDRDQRSVKAPTPGTSLPASGGPRRRTARRHARPGCYAGTKGAGLLEATLGEIVVARILVTLPG
jgi:HSP20 family molecular chaperone IbpA